ncbi:MAG: ATP-binding protein [Bacteroidia bacterium]
MLSPVNDNTQTYMAGIENFFLPVLSFGLDGNLKFANKAAKSLLSINNSIEYNFESYNFCKLFNIKIQAWKLLISKLMELNQPNTPLVESFAISGPSCLLKLEASFSISSASEFPEIHCAINKWESKCRDSGEDHAQAVNTKALGISNISDISFYKNLAYAMPNGGLLVFDKDLRCVFTDGTGSDILRYDNESAKGKKLSEIHSDNFEECLLPLYEDALEGKISHTEYLTESGNWYYISIGPYKNENKIEGGFALAFNINSFKKAEIERDKKIEELWYTNNQLKIENGVRKLIERNMYEQKFELEQKNQELEQFAYVASHDLQEPLRMVSSYTQLLGNRFNDKLDDEAREFISFAVEGATRMQNLITDLLSYSRIGRKEMSFEKINLDIVLQIVKRNLAILLLETQAEVICEKYPFVQADASQLVQLFQNLISNAIKFRQTDIKPVIRITAKNMGKFHRICVEDNGIGINMEYKDRIFQIFQRLHTRDKYLGTGIGLAICKKIVERHGGQIWIDSEIGIGTKFYFTISR